MRPPSLALVLASALLLPLAPGAEGSGSATLAYSPAASDAGAFFLRATMNEAADCMTWAWTFTMRATGEPLPFVFSTVAEGDGFRVGGRDVSTTLAGRDLVRGSWVLVERDPQAGDGHLMANVSAAGQPVFHVREQSGYDQASSRGYSGIAGKLCDLDCTSVFAPSAPACAVYPKVDLTAAMLSLVGTPQLSGASVQLGFWEGDPAFDPWSFSWQGTHGAARGALAFASDSNRAFLLQLKDLDGLAGYDGDPLGAGAGPNAAGLLVGKTMRVERGLAGGFGAFGPDVHADALSYVEPDGFVGATTQAVPLSQAQMMTTFEGPAGDWRFDAHLYASPRAHASLLLWGADVATG